MESPPKPFDEQARLKALRSLDILDTPPEEQFDRYTRLARKLFDAPIALISLVDSDRQWFKSRSGLDAEETPREVSFCAHAILREDVLVVEDAAADPRFADNPLVTEGPKIRFYAGYPLCTRDGYTIGTLCIIDRVSRTFDDEDRAMLQDIGEMVESIIASAAAATNDELTGLVNRRGFNVMAHQALAACRRHGKPATLLYFDLDGFKAINDEFGHREGDQALIAFSTLLVNCFRASDIVARLGGDEFAVLALDATDEQGAVCVERFESAVGHREKSLQSAYRLRFSVGSAEVDFGSREALDGLLEKADRRMYEDKRSKGAARPAMTAPTPRADTGT